MTTHATTSFDSHHRPHTIYSNRTYASTTTRQFHPYLTTLPLPSINVCENLLYDVTIGGCGDVESATSSSYINSSDHYDNTYINTYDNPIQYLENFSPKSLEIVNHSRNDLRHNQEDNLYDDAKGIEIDNNNNNEESSSSSTPRSTSPVLFYLENKSLAVCACIISLLLLLLVGLCIFLLNKLIRPVIINTTVNNHYSMSNLTNTTISSRSISSSSSLSTPLVMLLRRASINVPISSTTMSMTLTDELPFPYSSCAPDRWGIECENVCKPCGLGVCHPATGNCICPTGIYGEFCDLWQVNDKPKRGDLTR